MTRHAERIYSAATSAALAGFQVENDGDWDLGDSSRGGVKGLDYEYMSQAEPSGCPGLLDVA